MKKFFCNFLVFPLLLILTLGCEDSENVGAMSSQDCLNFFHQFSSSLDKVFQPQKSNIKEIKEGAVTLGDILIPAVTIKTHSGKEYCFYDYDFDYGNSKDQSSRACDQVDENRLSNQFRDIFVTSCYKDGELKNISLVSPYGAVLNIEPL